MPFTPTLPATAAAALAEAGTYADTLGGLSANVVAKSADFNVDVANIGAEYHVSAAGAVVVTIRTQASHAIPQYRFFFLARMGAGGVSVVGAGGVTINSPYGYLTLARQFSSARLLNLGSDSWLLTGDLA